MGLKKKKQKGQSFMHYMDLLQGLWFRENNKAWKQCVGSFNIYKENKKKKIICFCLSMCRTLLESKTRKHLCEELREQGQAGHRLY